MRTSEEWGVDAHNPAGSRRWRSSVFATSLLAASLLYAHVVAAREPTAIAVPDWLYPRPSPAAPVPPDRGRSATPADVSGRPLSVPGSDRQFTLAQVRDYFAVPDWHPGSQPEAPEVVMTGRKPDVLACGFCHLPDGAGRPENAALAGLPAAYIVEQTAAFASGARRSAWTDSPYLPSTLMASVARAATAAEVADAAAYFSALRLHAPRARIVEAARIPKIHSAAWVHSEDAGGGEELLGMRVIEVPRDLHRHELRDARVEYVAYVPPGSVARGRRLATESTNGKAACTSCHGADLRGLGAVPPIAGRSPTYLLRQLVAFRTGARSSPAAASMTPAVAELTLEEMIAAAAYSASLQP